MSRRTPPTPLRASDAERAYFARLAASNAAVDDQQPPTSLQETLDRMAAVNALVRAIGPADAEDESSDLASHLAFQDHIRTVTARRNARCDDQENGPAAVDS